MQKVPPVWILVSAVIAVVLWLLATLVERQLGGEDAAPPPGVAELERPRADSEVRTGTTGSMSCEQSEGRLQELIDGARDCTTDDDCTLFDYGYPMNCMTSVAKSHIPLLRQEYRQYDESCEFRVFFDCPTEPYVRLAVCRNNRCIVELDTSRDLEAPTLDHLEDDLDPARPD